MAFCIAKFSLTLLTMSLFFVANPAHADMRESLSDTITNMALDLSCDTDAQCKSIGFGDKPCGGFHSYKIYSTKTVDEDTFTKMVENYNALDKQNNLKNQSISTCEMLLQPSPTCFQGQCAALPSSGGV